MRVLGVRIDNFSKKDILAKIEFFLDEKSFHQIATVNPEFILQVQKNSGFREIINACDLNVADGVGIWFAFLRHGNFLKCRYAGADLMHFILQKAQKKNLPVFLAIKKDGLSNFEEIKKALSKKYPKVKFDGEDVDPCDCSMLHAPYSSVLFCNFGAPQQEIFINNQKDANIRLAIGVGGAFDFETGKVSRAPKIMRNFGLEWLWRFLLEPRYRFRRIFNAVIVFPVRVLFKI